MFIVWENLRIFLSLILWSYEEFTYIYVKMFINFPNGTI